MFQSKYITETCTQKELFYWNIKNLKIQKLALHRSEDNFVDPQLGRKLIARLLKSFATLLIMFEHPKWLFWQTNKIIFKSAI